MEHWLSDTQVTNCSLCNSLFTATNRKHHCRLCGDIFCDRCSAFSITYPELNLSNQRACKGCHTYVNTHLPSLQTGREFVYYTSGSKHTATVAVSGDEKSLLISYKGNIKPLKRLDLKQFKGVKDGQSTDVWKSHTEMWCCVVDSELVSVDYLCFSLEFGNETVDLLADNPAAKTTWLDAFKALLKLRQDRIANFIDTERERVAHNAEVRKQQEKEEKRKLIADKYANKREEIASRYKK